MTFFRGGFLFGFVAHRAVITAVIGIADRFTILSPKPRQVSMWMRAAECRLGRLTRRPGLAVTLVGLLAIGWSAMLSMGGHIPEPQVHDEFSHLLAADTFAHGRLSNPTHPLWVHFESFHIIHQPTYASKYPPAQGLMLAAGQFIGGHPIVGVWMSTGLACSAVSWMLLAWLPPRWAILGSLLVTLHPSILIQWGQSYWGGTVAMMGGALVFGAVRQIVRRPRAPNAVLLGVGLAVLANSRPYEGLVASLPVAVVLLAWMLKKSGPAIQESIRRILLPIFIILALTGGAMAFYNLRVSGDFLRMPYLVHEATYTMAPSFLWQQPRPEPTYRHKIIQSQHLIGLTHYMDQRSVWGLARESLQKIRRLWRFYHGPRSSFQFVLTVPIIVLPWVLRDRWACLALLTCGMMIIALLLETWAFPHYAAPITGLVCVLLLQAMRHLRLWRWRGRPIGHFLVWTILVIIVATSIMASADRMRMEPSGWGYERARILTELKEDRRRHLVIVRYGYLYSPYDKLAYQEWVYNGADLEGAKVVWARDMGRTQNRKLLQHFKDRFVWLLEVDQDHSPPKLVSYSDNRSYDFAVQ